MAKTVGQQTRGCIGCAGVVFSILVVWMLYHHFGWRPKVAPKDVRITNQRMAEVNRDYYRYHAEHGRYPESFEELESALGGTRSAYRDPWGNPYRILEKEGTVYLYSLGPDGVDDGIEVAYDPTNGVDSPGDISMILRRSGSSAE